MEYNWTALINNTSSSTTGNGSSVRTHNNGGVNNNHHHAAWETWDFGGTGNGGGVSREDWSYPLHNSFNYYTPTSGGEFHGVAPPPEQEAQHYKLDPHLTCLKLGKRHYFEDLTSTSHEAAAASETSNKKLERSYIAAAPPGVPRCQVEGCEVVLVNAKDYHRRHKVCEMHAKAPRVVLLGTQQRFCQQCSRSITSLSLSLETTLIKILLFNIRIRILL